MTIEEALQDVENKLNISRYSTIIHCRYTDNRVEILVYKDDNDNNPSIYEYSRMQN